jgi:molybdopterin-dependent oxidoreductase alpha subunit
VQHAPVASETAVISEPRKPVPVVTDPPDSAAGKPAVVEVMRQIIAKPGLARGVESLLKMNQLRGFDCPGCAWPEDIEHRKHAEFCENGAKAFADEATRRTINEDFFARYSVAELLERSEQWLNEQGRLAQPMVLRAGKTHYEAITWFSAYELIAHHLNELDSPDQAAFYTSGRTSNEAAFLWQLLARCFGTNNLPDCSNLCHESSGTALTEVIGNGKGTVRLSDFDQADAIFVLGQNPGSNHPRMLATLERAKQQGAVIVAVNPLDEVGIRNFRNPQSVRGLFGKGTELVDLHVPVRINGDVAFLKGLCKAMLEAEAAKPGSVLDREFIQKHTSGFGAFGMDIQKTSWADIEKGSGVTEADVRAAASIAINAKNTICCWAMGLTQHKNAVANIQEIINFLMLRGNLGRPGAGACPVRGHSNVQGDRTMGIWEKPSAAFLNRLGKRFAFTPPAAHGLDTVATIHAMATDRVKVLLALGGNFMTATPDSEFTARAVRNCSLTVQVSTKLNRSHLVTGATALILPALGRSEVDIQSSGLQFVTVENSMGIVTPSRGHLPPPSPYLRSEVRIVSEIAEAVLGTRMNIRWRDLSGDYHLVRDHIAAVIPGFEEFNDRLIMEGSIELPHGVRDERHFDTATGKAIFTVHPITAPAVPDGCYLMMTIRSHDQFNTTVYSETDRYRGVAGSRRVVFMNAEDIRKAGLNSGSRVAITSHFGAAQRTMQDFIVVPYRIPIGCVATYYPETNPLIPVQHVADGSNTPAYKSVVVSLQP